MESQIAVAGADQKLLGVFDGRISDDIKTLAGILPSKGLFTRLGRFELLTLRSARCHTENFNLLYGNKMPTLMVSDLARYAAQNDLSPLSIIRDF